MNTRLFSSLNKMILLLFAGMLAAFIINAVIQSWSIYSLNDEIHRYSESVKETKELKLIFHKQNSLWNTLISEKKGNEDIRRGFYEISRYSDTIQDKLYNLKIGFAAEQKLSQALSEQIQLHKNLARLYISLIFKIEFTPPQELEKQIAEIEAQNKKNSDSMDALSQLIEDHSRQKIASRQHYYVFIMALSFLLTATFFILAILRMLKANQKVQKNIIDLGKTLNSYIPPQLVLSIINNKPISLVRREITVCFADLEGFTAFAESVDPEIIAKILDEYLSTMAIIAQSWGGMVDKFMGDGVMIIFGAFESDADNLPLLCMHMAVAMQQNMKELIKKWNESGYNLSLGLRIGINTGYATIGPVGPNDRKAFTAIGTTVNIASRLEKLCTPGRIMIGHDTKVRVEKSFYCMPTEERTIKGISRQIPVYEVEP